MIRKFLEYIDQKSFDPISSFIVKDELNSKIWDDFKMKENIREDLLKIANDFYESTDLTAEIKDIILMNNFCLNIVNILSSTCTGFLSLLCASLCSLRKSLNYYST